jgi:hypothetical protein
MDQQFYLSSKKTSNYSVDTVLIGSKTRCFRVGSVLKWRSRTRRHAVNWVESVVDQIKKKSQKWPHIFFFVHFVTTFMTIFSASCVCQVHIALSATKNSPWGPAKPYLGKNNLLKSHKTRHSLPQWSRARCLYNKVKYGCWSFCGSSNFLYKMLGGASCNFVFSFQPNCWLVMEYPKTWHLILF